jgi:hypothetical protein
VQLRKWVRVVQQSLARIGTLENHGLVFTYLSSRLHYIIMSCTDNFRHRTRMQTHQIDETNHENHYAPG